MDLHELIAKLKASPLFYLFVASRELFHTNFWYWLYTLNAHEAAMLFGVESKKEDIIEFVREYKTIGSTFKSKRNIDLVIKINGKITLAVENKVKDFANDVQLKDIRHKMDEGTNLSLLTLFSIDNLEFEGWKIDTYYEMANRIVPENYTDNVFERELIARYKSFVLILCELADIDSDASSYDFIEKNDQNKFAILNDVKLWEAYIRFRGQKFIAEFKKGSNGDIKTHLSINRKKVTLDFFYPLGNSGRIGVQVEDGRFCKFVNIGKNKNTSLHIHLAENNIFFDNSYNTPRGLKFGTFNPDFYYQYEILGSRLHTRDIFEKIENCMKDLQGRMAEIAKFI